MKQYLWIRITNYYATHLVLVLLVVGPTSSKKQGCRGYGDSHGDFHGCGMGMGTVMNPHGSVGILWGFLNGCEIMRKRPKYDCDKCQSRFWISPNIVEFIIFLQLGLNDCWILLACIKHTETQPSTLGLCFRRPMLNILGGQRSYSWLCLFEKNDNALQIRLLRLSTDGQVLLSFVLAL